LWFKYVRKYLFHTKADLCSNPVDIYPYLYQNGVGTLDAYLYIHWACYLEETGDSNSADKVIDKGLKILAQPFDVLKKAQGHFQQRTMNRLREKLLMQKNQKVEPKTTTAKPTRKVFNSLSTEEAKTGLRTLSNGSNVVTSLKQPTLKKLGTTSKSNKTNFTIFEENQESNEKKRFHFDDEMAMKKFKPLPSEKEKKKENVGTADKWTSHQVKSKKVFVEKIQFSIFEDSEASPNEATFEKDVKLTKSKSSLYEELRQNPLKFVKQ
jgi:HD superfamily phosphohydrolase